MTKKTIAKFRCNSIEHIESNNNNYRIVKMRANTQASNEWSKWTPSGTLEIHVTNESCEFTQGKDYFITIEEC